MPEATHSFLQETICTSAALYQFKDEWLQLWQRCPNANPFQNPEWIIPWWRYFGQDKELQTLVFRDNGELVGVAPFCILRDNEGRKIMPLGIGLSDYTDVLFAPGYEASGGKAIFTHFSEIHSQWEICDLQPLLAGSPLLNVEFPLPITSICTPVDTLTSLDLPPDCDVFRRSLSRHFKDRLKDATRHAERIGAMCFETASGDNFNFYFDQLLQFHKARWNGSQENDAYNTSAEFHRETVFSMLQHGSLRLYALNIRGRAAAVLYGFLHQQRGFFYMMGFNSEFEKMSPGMLLMTHAIEELIREGASGCEFLRGREAFKYRWDVREQTTYSRRLLHQK